jgi:tryptophan halogenase
MLGQGVIPRMVDPLVAAVQPAEIEPRLELLRKAMSEYAATLPSHAEALRKYCAAEAA